MLELLGRHVNPRTLVGIFTLLGGAVPSSEHIVLAAHRGNVITTNQDLLIEAAAKQLDNETDILHLHGDWRHPSSVVALISQYVIGLKRRVRDRFRDLLRDREVLVVGYSGRDRDVLPYLADARQVRWRHYVEPGAAPRPLSQELLNLMMARPGLVTVEETSEPLAPLTKPGTLGVGSRPARALELTSGARQAFAAVDPRAADLALIQVLQRAGASDFAEEALRALARDPGALAADVEQALGNVLAGRQPNAAEHHYGRAATLATSSERIAAAELGLANLASNRSDYVEAEAALQRALWAGEQVPGRQRDRILGRILARSARMHVMTDQEGRSMREYRRAFSAARRCGDIDTLVEALTFGSDPWRSRGRYAAAMGMLDEARSDVELYARPGLAAWFSFYLGNSLGAMHRLDEAQAEFAHCRNLAQATGNLQLEAWSWTMSCNFHRAEDLHAAADALRRGRRSMERFGSKLFALQARLTFEDAELLRARRRWSACQHASHDLAAATATRASQRMPYLEAHLAALRAEVARDRGQEDVDALIAIALRRYREGRWAHGAARMELSRWLLRGGPPPPRLVERCRRLSYGFELEQLTLAVHGGYVPLLTI